jgi:hypothetical protein
MRGTLAITVAVLVCGLIRTNAKELPPGEFNRAQKLYNLKCAKCHELYDPTGYSRPEWDKWMKKMGRKSKLKPEQYDLVAEYTETLRKGAPKKSR